MKKHLQNLGEFDPSDDNDRIFLSHLCGLVRDEIKETHLSHFQKKDYTGKTIAFQEQLAKRVNEKWTSATIAHLVSASKKSVTVHENRITFLHFAQSNYDLKYYRDDKNNPAAEWPEKTNTAAYAVLARELALNLVDVSIDLEEQIPYKHILKSKNLQQKRKMLGNRMIVRERFVAVVGAGASNAATVAIGGIPKSEEVLNKIEDNFESRELQEILAEKREELESQFGKGRDGRFEEQMRAMIRVSAEKVISQLKEECGYRHTPSLLYEILAHLLKHRFLDTIVNFNYDEILDNAISEELPDKDDYRFVYTAGHCPENLEGISVNHRIRQPIYVKCHGTISHPNSLRFGDQNPFTIEKAIQQHLKELFTARLPRNKEKEMALNLILFGFSMRNDTFNKVIELVYRNKKKPIKIWILDHNDELENELRSRLSHIVSKNKKPLEFCHVPLVNGSMEETLVEMWKEITKCFTDDYAPKGIVRHELTSLLFGQVSPRDLYNDIGLRNSYHSNRIHFEIALHLLRSGGRLHLSQISGSRIGSNFNALSDEERKHQSLQDYLERMGLSVYKGFMHDTFTIPDMEVRKDPEQLIDFLLRQLQHCLTSEFSYRLNEIRRDEARGAVLKGLLLQMTRRRRGMVTPKYKNIHNNLFSRLKKMEVMNTSLAWVYNYRSAAVINHNSWDFMLAISEKGGFLRNDLGTGLFDNKCLELILATFDLEGDESKRVKELRKLQLASQDLHFLPWWRHNKHMVILMKRNRKVKRGSWKDKWSFSKGFYYTHQTLSRRITPVMITKKKDGYKLLEMYATYWAGAQNYSKLLAARRNSDSEETAPQLSMDIITEKRTVDEVLKMLFERAEKRLKAMRN